jgi:uncharacterized protein YukE
VSLYGANPDELEHLGLTLKRQIEAINGVLGSVGGVLRSTTWMGPARERFTGEWEGSFTSALQRLNQAFEAAGTDCQRRAGELRRVMGSH